MSIDDARITAYVLDELSESKKAVFEREMANNPELQAEVDAVREFTEFLEEELVVEDCPQLENSQRKEVLDLLEEPQIKKFPKWTFILSSAALLTICMVIFGDLQKYKDFYAVAEGATPMQVSELPPERSKPVATSRNSEIDSSSTSGKRARMRLMDDEGPRGVGSVDLNSSKEQGIPDEELLRLELQEAARRKMVKQATAQAAEDILKAKREISRKQSALAIQYKKVHEAKKKASKEREATLKTQKEVIASSANKAVQLDRKENHEGADEIYPSKPSAPRVTAEKYPEYIENSFEKVEQKPLSTFSIDVDTASYTNLRSQLNRGYIPHKGSIRIEEMINYFNYDYPEPESNRPFSVNLEMAQSPWSQGNQLVQIGLKGKDVKSDKRPNCNLVFLIDVSGSMSASNKLPLLKEGFQKMVAQLTDKDRVGIVVYAGNAGVVLEPTICDQRGRDLIIGALGRLNSGGSTNGAGGIKEAYQLVQQNFMPGGVNRVILATDGDFNVGTSSTRGLVDLVKQKAKEKAYLTVLGFGRGNLNDRMMEEISNKGNGNYFYIDSAQESTRVLCEKINGTLVTIAKDVKIQVEFNPTLVHSYRLIGYDNRKLKARDFNDDKKDAGEIGAGHTVTAIYEVVPVGSVNARPEVDQLKYQLAVEKAPEKSVGEYGDELLTVKLRYKAPQGGPSTLISYPLKNQNNSFIEASKDFTFASSVAAFGMLTKESDYSGDVTVDDLIRWVQSCGATKNISVRDEFMSLLRQYKKLKR